MKVIFCSMETQQIYWDQESWAIKSCPLQWASKGSQKDVLGQFQFFSSSFTCANWGYDEFIQIHWCNWEKSHSSSVSFICKSEDDFQEAKLNVIDWPGNSPDLNPLIFVISKKIPVIKIRLPHHGQANRGHHSNMASRVAEPEVKCLTPTRGGSRGGRSPP